MDHLLQEDSNKKAYEVSFLLASAEKVESVKRLLNQHGIDIKEEQTPKNINLAYPIEKVTQALFCAITVFSEPEKIKLLEKDMKTSRDILRCLIVILPKEKAGESSDQSKRVSSPVRRVTVIQRELKPKTLSNEALEKKIEEILQ